MLASIPPLPSSPFAPPPLKSPNPNPNPNPRFKFKLKRRSLLISSSIPDAAEGAKVEYTPWLIAGLGNPGNKYHGTRHNVGFEMVNRISRDEGIPLNTIQSKSLIGVGSIGEVPILLAKPQAYMNFSGEACRLLTGLQSVDDAKLTAEEGRRWLLRQDRDY